MKPKEDELWMSNGRINEIGQSGFDDVERRPYITQRWPDNYFTQMMLKPVALNLVTML